jgi:glycine cleavage system H protein
MNEDGLLYSASHEWARIEGDDCVVGITRFAVEQLTDVTYVELPPVGRAVTKGKPFGVIESVKSANDLYAPVSGEVVEVNARVADDPASIATDPYGEGWMIKIRTTGSPDLSGLMKKVDYDAQTAASGH